MTWSSLPLLHTLMTFKSSKIFLWSALEPCSPVGKWLDGAPPKRYPDTTHTTQHCWRSPKPLVHNYSWIKSLDWSSLWGEPIRSPQVWDIWLEWSECWKTTSSLLSTNYSPTCQPPSSPRPPPLISPPQQQSTQQSSSPSSSYQKCIFAHHCHIISKVDQLVKMLTFQTIEKLISYRSHFLWGL